MKKIVFILVLGLLMGGVAGCDTFQKAKNQALSLIGLGETKTTKKKTTPPKTEKVVGEAESDPAEEKSPSQEDIKAPTEGEEAKGEELAPPSDAPSALEVPVPEAPNLPPSAEAPVEVSEAATSPQMSTSPFTISAQLAGKPQALFADKEGLYVASGMELKVYDTDLNFKSSVLLGKSALSVVASGMPRFVYVIEESNTLEILSESPQGLTPLKSFEVTGTAKLQVVNSNPQLVVLMPDRFQVLDLKNPQADIPVTLEWPEKADDVYLASDLIYVASGQNLKIIRLADLSVVSKYDVGVPFKIGGHISGSSPALVLILQDAKSGKWASVQKIKLNASGVLNSAQGVVALPAHLSQVISLKDDKFFYADETGLLQAASFQSPSQPEKDLPAVSGIFAIDQDRLFVAASGDYSVYKIEAAPTPAEGLAKTGGPRYVKLKSLTYPTSVEAVLLAGPDKLALVSSQIFAMPNGLKDPPLYQALGKGNYKAQKLHLTPTGFLFFNGDSGKLHLLLSDLSGEKALEMAAQNIKGFDQTRVNNTDRLVYATEAKEGRGENALVWARVDGGKIVKPEAKLKIGEAGGMRLFASGTRVLMASGIDGMVLYELADKPKAVKKLQVGLSRIPGAKALDVLMDFNEKWALVYHESPNGNFVSVVTLTPDTVTEVALIGDLTMTAQQFAGASFADGGKTVIFPHEKGVSFYNLTNPAKPQKLPEWPIGPSLFVDVTNRGKTLCVARGEAGVLCGDRL